MDRWAASANALATFIILCDHHATVCGMRFLEKARVIFIASNNPINERLAELRASMNSFPVKLGLAVGLMRFANILNVAAVYGTFACETHVYPIHQIALPIRVSIVGIY